MSASLVGSEMCIRDSVLLVPALAVLAVVAPLGLPLVGALADVVRVGAVPVSYTHLTLPTICSV
eukprot:14658574-Alexandrium_andersonii.AAC.1